MNQKSKAYSENQKNVSCFDLTKQVTELKKQEEYEWLNEVHSQPLQMALHNLDNAYTNFFKKQSKFPNFKKKSRKQSFQYPQGVKVIDDKVFLPKIGWCDFVKHRAILGEIKTVTVSKTPTGSYFISILCDTKVAVPPKQSIQRETAVGVDVGIKTFAVSSNGKVFENQKYLTSKLRRLKVEQRKLQRGVKKSRINAKTRPIKSVIT